jgi:hypothetical protein
MNAVNWFECRIKYTKPGEEGKEKKVAESYLLDAVSYTEAEGRMALVLESMGTNMYEIASLRRSNITEIVESNDGNDDKWYKAKIGIEDVEELTGKEKHSYRYFLIAGATLERALENLRKSLSTYVVPCQIFSLTDTTFVEVLPYFPKEDGAEQKGDYTKIE